jgi:hypothetical protein
MGFVRTVRWAATIPLISAGGRVTSRRAGQGMGGSGSPVVPGGGARSENETSKSALGDRKPKRRFRRQFPHTETRPYLQNAAGARGFERSFNVRRRTSAFWNRNSPRLSAWGGRTRNTASRILRDCACRYRASQIEAADRAGRVHDLPSPDGTTALKAAGHRFLMQCFESCRPNRPVSL